MEEQRCDACKHPSRAHRQFNNEPWECSACWLLRTKCPALEEME